MTLQQKKKTAAFGSVMASFFLTGLKLVVGLMTGSIGILSEAAHSALDMGAALITYFSVRISDKPPDDSHPYGHGKVESVSALIETGLLFFTSVWIVVEAVQRLRSGAVEVQATWYAFAVVIVSILVDISRSRALNAIAKETNSQALEADALHFSSDILSSAVVLVGLVFVQRGMMGADALAAIGVACFVAVVGCRLGKRTIGVLIDAAPAGIAAQVKECVSCIDGVLGIERIRVRALGPSVFVDLVVYISRKYSLEKVGVITRRIEDALHLRFPGADVLVHTKPAQHDGETVVELIQVLASQQGLFVHNILVENAKGKKCVSYDLEVPEELSLGEAHAVATALEDLIREKISGEIEIDTHIDPLGLGEIPAEEITAAESAGIEREVVALSKTVAPECEVYGIRIRKVKNSLSLVLHCSVEKDIPLRSAHDIANTIEHVILNTLPRVKRVIVHVEPKGQEQ